MVLAASRELCVLHVDDLWTSTRRRGVNLMWTGEGVKNPDFLVNVINGWLLTWRSMKSMLLKPIGPKWNRITNGWQLKKDKCNRTIAKWTNSTNDGIVVLKILSMSLC